MHINIPTLRLGAAKAGDTVRFADGNDPRAFTVGGHEQSSLQGYTALVYRERLTLLVARSQPIILVASALDTSDAIE